ncbi:MAG: N(G),N(G)-dimethylarginine dimethylaminohydrolase [Anaerolineales bacterium]|nr:N(G),N(G)-dimethylarginine dimethylaminohydrolase [Anaerolineales bacterium]
MLTAVVRQPATTINQCELTYMERVPISPEAALSEHAAYSLALNALGVRVVALPALAAYPDSVFTEDVAVVLDEVALLTRPGADSRRGEVAEMATTLARYRPLRSLTAPATLEGGDVLRIGRRIFVGQSTRTNAEGVRQLRALAEPFGYSVTPVSVPGALHLKTAATALDEHTLIANTSWLDLEPFEGMDVLAAPPEEPWGANVLAVGEARLVNAACPRTLDLLAHAGYAVQPIDLTEFAKAEAGLTCLSLVFRTAARPSNATPGGT